LAGDSGAVSSAFWILLALGLAACAAPPQVLPEAPIEQTAVTTSDVQVREATARVLPRGIDPEILLPSSDTTDDVVATVGDLSIHKRHVYEHLLKTEPAAPRRLIDVIVLDAQVAHAARRWGITLDSETVERKAAEQEKQLRTEVQRQLGVKVTLGHYLERQFGMGEEEYSQWLRTKIIRELYRQYVLRFAALREERVEVRYIVNSDPDILRDVADRVRQGASFATLAIRHTEDANRMDGGLLPPFGRGFDHPVAEVAFGLSPGELSDVFVREVQGSKRYYLVYCLRRIPSRDVEFSAVRDELTRDIENRPLAGMEFRAASMSLKAALESLNSDSDLR